MKAWMGLTLAAALLGLAGCDKDRDERAETPKPPKAEKKKDAAKGASGWTSWRGPHQNGYCDEQGLPDRWDGTAEQSLWTLELPGRGTPVILGGRAYVWGYRGHGPDLREVLDCVDTKSGKVLWERTYPDFTSDTAYERYAIGSPAVDPETGNVYLLTTGGEFFALDASGRELWHQSHQDTFGRLTFPNGRTGAPVIDGDLVIVRGITSFWGNQGPARDRFYAFDKRTGAHVWACEPGVGPKDSSYSTIVLDWWNGRRVFYAGTGCGNVICGDARTGEALWRVQFSYGGVNSGIVRYKDLVIAIHDKENLDSSESGRMAAFRTPAALPEGARPAVLGKEAEAWRNDLSAFSSSPVLVGDRVYVTTMTGELASVDAGTGKIVWRKKLGNEQLHASPLYADGKLYVPMVSGEFFIVRPSDAGPEVLTAVKLEGSCLGSPAVYDGKVYLHTTKRLYCFGNKKGAPVAPAAAPAPAEQHAPVLQAVPSELLARPGEKIALRFRWSDGKPFDPAGGTWAGFIPPTAKVQAKLNGTFLSPTEFQAGPEQVPSAGMFKFTAADGKTTAFVRGRVLPYLPISEDFESFKLAAKDDAGEAFDYPPLPWIGARFKWEVRDLNGNKVLAKTLDNLLFQRAITYIGHPDMKNYTLQADVMTDGNRRWMSNVGVINQRYVVALIGNAQVLEVSSNHDLVKVSVPFKWQPSVWYTLKTRVDLAEDGSGTIRAKAWKKGDAEPAAWTIEVPHKVAHTHGSPGLFGFSPQAQKKVFMDNIVITKNE